MCTLAPSDACNAYYLSVKVDVRVAAFTLLAIPDKASRLTIGDSVRRDREAIRISVSVW